MTINGGLGEIICAIALLVSGVMGPNVASSASPTPVAISHEIVNGKKLEPVAPYKKEVTVSGMQKLAISELFSGAFVVDVFESQDGGTLLLKDYPFDQFVQVLKGTTTLASQDGSSYTYVAGESFVVPRGFNGTWTTSKGFREMLIIEAKSLKEGIGQFE